jgi:hypothetical protein
MAALLLDLGGEDVLVVVLEQHVNVRVGLLEGVDDRRGGLGVLGAVDDERLGLGARARAAAARPAGGDQHARRDCGQACEGPPAPRRRSPQGLGTVVRAHHAFSAPSARGFIVG